MIHTYYSVQTQNSTYYVQHSWSQFGDRREQLQGVSQDKSWFRPECLPELGKPMFAETNTGVIRTSPVAAVERMNREDFYRAIGVEV
jgi:hypothetical protein